MPISFHNNYVLVRAILSTSCREVGGAGDCLWVCEAQECYVMLIANSSAQLWRADHRFNSSSLYKEGREVGIWL